MDATTIYVVLGVSIFIFILTTIALLYLFKKLDPYVNHILSRFLFGNQYSWVFRMFVVAFILIGYVLLSRLV